ncbi:hypothetical protein [Rhodobium gokarnense]|uniref:Uncharacterized protein n=1 Tax=Rhodobium gokarnense TaxID=364296 RepID=A0ABT3H887_9HYPH|nr:hypothetical protein [Rhodobium gokarnense]MCW2306612.1 hypothetical protein [Rhodobium gokarnense]
MVDSDYIVALETERLLTETFGMAVTILNPTALAEHLKEHAFCGTGPRHYELVVYDTGLPESQEMNDVGELHDVAAHLMFTTTHDSFLGGVPGFPGIPVVGKPYDVRLFEDAVGASLSFNLSARLKADADGVAAPVNGTGSNGGRP